MENDHWSITIFGEGNHHTGDPTDAYQTFFECVERLKAQGQVITHAAFNSDKDNGHIGSGEQPRPKKKGSI